ncbi:MAG: lysophospholipid acyltransferase family protein [Desulfovibrio sp.]|jgi:lysophospholipid acyltransferase (LPLAT)-like uncharacterized protein|nr:lysophospholipid acyltransferase family protein [Desulfovibrio sp.]
MSVPFSLLARPINILYRLWCSSLHIVQTGRETVDGLDAQGRIMIFALFHDELFSLMHVRENLRLVTVVSRSRDGEYLARLLQSLGLKTARGSSSRQGASALRQIARIMREDKYHGVITVDGPRGPRHKVKQGAIILAFRTPAIIQPVRLFPNRAKRFNSWDRFQLPLPFTRVDIVFGEPYAVRAAKLDEEIIVAECLELERRLKDLRPTQLLHAGQKGRCCAL